MAHCSRGRGAAVAPVQEAHQLGRNTGRVLSAIPWGRCQRPSLRLLSALLPRRVLGGQQQGWRHNSKCSPSTGQRA